MAAPSLFASPYGGTSTRVKPAGFGGVPQTLSDRIYAGAGPAPTAAPAAPNPNPYTGMVYKKGYSDIAHQGYNELGTRYGRGAGLYDLYQGALADPAAQGRKFQDFFTTAAKGITDPAMRDFNKEVSNVGANVAARFGGNASSEEARQTYNTSDLFSRNLTEALARLAPQAAGLGLEYTGELGTAARGAVNEQDQLTQLILQALNKPKKPNTLGQLAGTAIGTAGGALLGGPAGAKAGGAVGGITAGGV